MIEGVKEIGSMVLCKDRENIIEGLLKEVPSERRNKKQHLMILDFYPEKDIIEIDFEAIDRDTPKKYIWIGNPKASNSPRDRLTTDNLSHLISQVIPNLVLFLPECELKTILKQILEQFFFDLGEQKGQDNRYRYVLDLKKVGIGEDMIENARNEVAFVSMNRVAKETVKRITNVFFNYLKEKYNFSKDELSLFTIKANGKILAKTNDYIDYIESSLIEDSFLETTNGHCHLCNKKQDVTYDTTKFRFTYYITDKIGFSSELKGKSNDGFLKNFSLCRRCYKELLTGETFILNHLKTNLVGFDLLIVPKFIFTSKLESSKLVDWSEYVKGKFSSICRLEDLYKFEKKIIEDYILYEDSKNSFIINLLFFRQEQSAFKILKLIKDVPPSRIDVINENIKKVGSIGDKIFGEDNRWYITLTKMYYLFPIKVRRGQNIDYRKLLEFYDQIFSLKLISYDFLINQFIELAKVYRFEKFAYFNIKEVSDSSIGLAYTVLEANLLLLLLRKLGLLSFDNRGEMMIEKKIAIDEGILNYIKELNYTEPQQGLFMLGYLIGEVGNSQWIKGDTSKSILGKITFQGIDTNKLLRLCNDVFQKLREYRKLDYNEVNYFFMKNIVDKYIKRWPLSDQENVFYILSGYAFSTHNFLKRAKDKGSENVKNSQYM